MKTLLSALCLILSLAAPSFAATEYVSDVLVVTVRDRPDNGASLLTTVQTGAPLEILEELKDFVRVRTEKGVEGYVHRQYVTKELPKAEQIKRLKAANAKLQQQVDDLTVNLRDTRDKAKDLSSTQEELTRIKGEYQELQQASANVVQITLERDQLQQENSDMALLMQQLKEENNLYLRTGVIKWFLAGAGVLCFGWLLGKISRKKKRSYL